LPDALVKYRASATAKKYRMWRTSMAIWQARVCFRDGIV
jgi:hypothetical protein